MYQDPYQSSDQPVYESSGIPPLYGPLPSRPQKKTRGLWILLGIVGGLVSLLCIGSVCIGSIAILANSPEQSDQTTKSQVTSPVQAHQTATSQATAHSSYISALSGGHAPAFVDPLSQESGSKWGSSRRSRYGGACLFTAGAYHVSEQPKGYYKSCPASGTFSNFAFEVKLTITQGDCGGMTLRDDGNGHFYYFDICQNGRYRIYKYVSLKGSDAIILQSKSSATINPGLGQQNKIAVVALGNTMTFYVNEQQIDQEQDGSYASGKLSLIAYPRDGNVTDVAYSDARLWMR